MFKQSKFTEGGLEVYEISDNDGTTARFVPERGGILTEFVSVGTPMFYIDKSTLYDTSKNVRGGNPVLFPICGPLEDGRYEGPGGALYEMKQHGLARNMSWDVAQLECYAGSARITLEAASDHETIQAYPYEFRLVFSYMVEPGRVVITQQYYNKSKVEMPFYASFHPYFLASGAKATALHIPAWEYHDLITGKTDEYAGFVDLNACPETNLVFSGLTATEAGFYREDGRRVTVRFDENFRYIVLWALKDKDFLCIEPWMGDNYDMNRGRAMKLAAGGVMTTEVSYSFDNL